MQVVYEKIRILDEYLVLASMSAGSCNQDLDIPVVSVNHLGSK